MQIGAHDLRSHGRTICITQVLDASFEGYNNLKEYAPINVELIDQNSSTLLDCNRENTRLLPLAAHPRVR